MENTSAYKNLNRDLKTKGVLKDGQKAHHWSYEDINLKDVFIMSEKLHRKLHIHLVFDVDLKLFFFDRMPLTSKKKHFDAILRIMLKYNIEEDVLSYVLK